MEHRGKDQAFGPCGEGLIDNLRNPLGKVGQFKAMAQLTEPVEEGCRGYGIDKNGLESTRIRMTAWRGTIVHRLGYLQTKFRTEASGSREAW